jgi:hypothetical protein
MPIPKSGVTFDDALEGFRATAEGVARKHFADNDYTFAVPNVEIAKGGRKYIKLIRTESDTETGEVRGQSFVHSFVEIATGDIFKPASFKVPAKHARGSIYRDSGRDSMEPAGHIRYLR